MGELFGRLPHAHSWQCLPQAKLVCFILACLWSDNTVELGWKSHFTLLSYSIIEVSLLHGLFVHFKLDSQPGERHNSPSLNRPHEMGFKLIGWCKPSHLSCDINDKRLHLLFFLDNYAQQRLYIYSSLTSHFNFCCDFVQQFSIQ